MQQGEQTANTPFVVDEGSSEGKNQPGAMYGKTLTQLLMKFE
jgi:hypothetical protein